MNVNNEPEAIRQQTAARVETERRKYEGGKANKHLLEKERAQYGDKQSSEAEEQEDDLPYFVDADGYLCRHKNTQGGKLTIRLANFTAKIADEEIHDDGVERAILYNIEGSLYNKRPLPRIATPASLFAGMSWVTRWGSQPILEPGQTVKDQVRHAIQISSQDVKELVYYTHVGWRKIGDNWCYLHADGCIGAANTAVKLPSELMRYSLPLSPFPQPDSERESIDTSLSFLDIGRRNVTIPLYCSVFLAAITTLLQPMPNFSM